MLLLSCDVTLLKGFDLEFNCEDKLSSGFEPEERDDNGLLLPKLSKLLSGLEEDAGAGNDPEDWKLLCVEPLPMCKLDENDPPDGLAWPEKLPPPLRPDAPDVAELDPDTRSPPFWVPSVPDKLDCAPFGPVNVDVNDPPDGDTFDRDLRANGPSCPEDENDPLLELAAVATLS